MVAVSANSPGSRKLLAGFVLVITLPVAALIWLGLQLAAQDRELSAQRKQERRELAADRAVSTLERVLADTERRLAEEAPPEEGAVRIRLKGGQVSVSPVQEVAYYPEHKHLPEPPPDAFRSAEELEFRNGEPGRAGETLRRLAVSPDPAIRAGALMRLARVLRKAGRKEDALEAYARLAMIPNAALEGVPADLVGHRARIVLLRELGRPAGAETAALEAGLDAGRWQLDRATYLHFAGRPPDRKRAALSEAAGWLWNRQHQLPSSGRSIVETAGVAVLLLWRKDPAGVSAIAALPEYQKREWFSRLDALGNPIRLTVPAGQTTYAAGFGADWRRSQRFSPETGLPWNVTLYDPPGADLESAARGRLMLAGLAAILAVLGVGVYFIARALAREMAVMRLQSDFVAAVSHEFRTPLTSMRQFTELLMQAAEPPAEKRQTFYRAQLRSTERLHRLVESLLDFGRMEAGRHPYALRSVDATGLASIVVDDFRNEAGPRGFTVEWQPPARPVRIQADPDALARALWNLLDNAAKYSGDSRWIGVEIESSDGWVSVRVKDRGVGIPASEQTRIFEKFVRGARAGEDGIKGTGIGLAMVRHIVEAHRGRIDADSEPGRGSTFTISIPAED